MSSAPYQAPRQESPPQLKQRVLPCPKCQSLNTTPDDIFRPKPSIIAIIFFGWVFILIRTAFSSRKTVCRDCGEIRKERTAGSNVAMIILIVFVLLLVVAYLDS